MTRILVSLVPLFFAGLAWADAPDPVRTAVVKGLRRIEQGSANYLKNRKCFSCHHQAVTIHCLAAARKRGLEVDPTKLRQQVDFTLDTFRHKREQVARGKAVPGGNTMAAYALFALEAAGQTPDETTAALVEYLVVKQKADGSWPALMQRPPSEGSSFTNAALALGALRTFRSTEQAERVDRAFARGRDWLRKTEPKNTEDRAFRLRGLVNAGADAREIVNARDALLKEQLADGSWKQLPDRRGDAYAAATVLTALRHAGLPTTDAAYQRGIQYLLSTQRKDGAWIVETRSRPVQTFFDNGDPGGKSQFLGFLSTCWAVAALLETMPMDVPSPTIPAK